jgi:hypothetical protein
MPVAQMEERWTPNPNAEGSNPSGHATFERSMLHVSYKNRRCYKKS